MEYRRLKRDAIRSPGRAAILRDIHYLLALLDEEPEDETELLEEMASLREAVNDLESAIREMTVTLHDTLNPTLFPEPLRNGPPPRERELSYNGLIELSCDEDEVPF